MWSSSKHSFFTHTKTELYKEIPTSYNMYRNFEFPPTCPYPFLPCYSGSSDHCCQGFLTPQMWSLPVTPGMGLGLLASTHSLMVSWSRKRKTLLHVHKLEEAQKGQRIKNVRKASKKECRVSGTSRVSIKENFFLYIGA